MMPAALTAPLVTLIACAAALPGLASEPGSGLYAAHCSAPEPEVRIDIAADGSASVATDGAIYPDLITSYSFFGDTTPPEFRVAILFSAAASPLPPVDGRPGWIEIWNGAANFFALENGQPGRRLEFCGDLAALAPPRQTVDCAAAATGVARLICDTPAVAATDTRLAEALAAARDNIDTADLAALEAEQTAWIAARDACAAAADPLACVNALYRDRIALLSARYGLASAGATRNYACAGGEVDLLHVTPFDTDPPSVNLVVGDRSLTALLRPAGSGGTYEAPSGETFRSQGDAAILEWPKDRESRCSAH